MYLGNVILILKLLVKQEFVTVHIGGEYNLVKPVNLKIQEQTMMEDLLKENYLIKKNLNEPKLKLNYLKQKMNC